MRIAIVTALFDINREKLGDGRKIEEYLSWFEKTLNLKCDFIVYTEEKFKRFVEESRKNTDYKTTIVTQSLDKIPYFKYREVINLIINSLEYRSKIKDVSRIECNLPEYNVIQYSKFGWLEHAVQNYNYDYIFWMDAGCSRFFNGFDLETEWPNKLKLDIDKLTIQGNANYLKMFDILDINEYIWDNNCVLVGTLFGGGRQIIEKLYNEIDQIFESLVEINCVNNEQFALAIFAKKNTEIMNTVIHIDGTHLPLFRLIG